MTNPNIGVLLINLGTPNSPKPADVHAYLKQFLNDPRVIDLPKPIRYMLINWFIIPSRYKKTARAYQQIWTPAGSPLLANSTALITTLATELGPTFQIELGMRYSNPSIQSAMDKLKHCSNIIAIPLFPQYSSAATGSTLEELFNILKKQWNIPEIHIKKDFFNHPDFIQSYASLIKENLKPNLNQTLIFSYHGLPERHIDKSNCRENCTRSQPCPPLNALNTYCYRAQCYETSRLIAKELTLNATNYVVCFQSRIGRATWIKPYTNLMLQELRQKKIDHAIIVCPSFVSDCLETLEEINIRARAQWITLGGQSFTFIPCLNQYPLWIKALANIIRNL